MEQYVTFRAVEDAPEQFAHVYARDGDAGLEVVCVPYRESRVLVLTFGRVPAFRVTLEECHLGGFEGEWEHPNEHMASFTVLESKWLAQFQEAELVHYPNAAHYVFLSHDQFVEVIARRQPSAEWRHAG